MHIDLEQYRRLDEPEAFKGLLDVVSEASHQKFVSMMGEKAGWFYDFSNGFKKELEEDLKKHASRIEQDGYDKEDLLDIINLAAMLYNSYNDFLDAEED